MAEPIDPKRALKEAIARKLHAEEPADERTHGRPAHAAGAERERQRRAAAYERGLQERPPSLPHPVVGTEDPGDATERVELVLSSSQRRRREAAREHGCPYCGSGRAPIAVRPITPSGMVLIVAGLFLAPVLVGIALIIVGYKMREPRLICPGCGLRCSF